MGEAWETPSNMSARNVTTGRQFMESTDSTTDKNGLGSVAIALGQQGKSIGITLRNEDRTKCEVWSRVMGYHRPVSHFNIGKKSEFAERLNFKEPKEVTSGTNHCGC